MLKLKNIQIKNNIITAVYDPEDSGLLGSISIDVKSGDVIESKASEYDSNFPIYLYHATNGLKDVMNRTELPKEKTIMWH